ncbi:hypothetical protein GALL_484800 [mine drainage metagenome]|uniref:Uncharacterized protein n=1 Tax=mine drainage metagenome TaxID=410659 RepID=A0A1J5PGK5_9ZZZZ
MPVHPDFLIKRKFTHPASVLVLVWINPNTPGSIVESFLYLT